MQFCIAQSKFSLHIKKFFNLLTFLLRWSLLHSMVDQADSEEKYALQDFELLQEVLSIISSKNSITSSIHTEVNSLLPSSVSTVLQQWNSNSIEDCNWVSSFLNNLIFEDVYLYFDPF